MSSEAIEPLPKIMMSLPASCLSLDRDAHLAGHYRLDAVRGHLHERAGDHASAARHYRAAAARTASTPERNYLLERAARVEQR